MTSMRTVCKRRPLLTFTWPLSLPFLCFLTSFQMNIIEDHEANRASWNAATERHRSHKPDLVKDYVENNRNNLFEEDLELLGDLSGKTVLHLQCNDGQDTVSIARHCGAPRRVVGVDISDTAIEFANDLRAKLDAATLVSPLTTVEFVRNDIFHFLEDPTHANTFDVVYTSYGTICWISDLQRWGKGIHTVLREGGKVVLIDFHPMGTAVRLEESASGVPSARLSEPSMHGVRCEEAGVGDYVGNDYSGAYFNPHRSVEFGWGLCDILTGLLGAGLQITHAREYAYVNGWQMQPGMKDVSSTQADRNCQQSKYCFPDGVPKTPLMYSFAAMKPQSSL